MMQATDRGTHVFGRPLGLVLIAAYKALWGSAEIGAGLLLIFSSRIIAGELAKDPTDLFVNWLLSHTPIKFPGVLRVGEIIVALGTVKLLLAAGMWYRSWTIRNAALVVFAIVGAFGVYDLSLKFSVWKLLATAADLFIVYYLWRIMPRHIADRGVH